MSGFACGHDSNGSPPRISPGIEEPEEKFNGLAHCHSEIRETLDFYRNPEEGWSGLSESNRHLNLGKVPYYHYTKAAQQHFFL
jgi:hypothetical protein